MRRAIQRRDADYDGAFYFAVRTTGVFCNPSCSARKPHARHCVYFRTPSEAMRAGYRPCKRCRPEQADTLAPEWIRPLLARVESGDGERLTDRDLCAIGLSPSRVRRFFRSRFGMTFQRFARQRRLASAVTHIRKGLDVTTTALRSGYESISGFESAARRVFGTTARRVATAQPIFSKTINSPIGPLLLGANDEGLCILSFSEGRSVAANMTRLSRQLKCPVLAGAHELLDSAAKQLSEYFAGKRREFDLPLHYPGTPFQRAVWSALRRIPFGRTWTYEQLARAVGRPGAQRAVGTANGSNRIAIIIPCHRVVNKNGKIGGYGGGAWRKEFLLELERSAASR